MKFKAIINKFAKENKIAAQAVLQTYMLERFLERISLSNYKNNFILKGGMLISSIIGIDSRTTMDMDTTIKGFKLNKENILNIMSEICDIKIDDNVSFKVTKIEEIRDDDEYGGFRVSFESFYNSNMPVILKIDITTGDKITYKEEYYEFKLMFEERKIQVLSYNIETIIAEKFESILKRGPLSTRIRDYYDVYILLHTQKQNINKNVLKDAIKNTFKYRKSIKLLDEFEEIIELLKFNENMIKQWKRYQKNNFFAEDIIYEDLISSIYDVYNMIKYINGKIKLPV